MNRWVKKISDKHWVRVVVLFSVVTAFHLWSLMRFPPPFVDEAWNAARAWGFVHTGRPFGPLDAGVFDRFEGYWTFFPWLAVWIQSLSVRLCGAPTLFAVRIVSLAFGLVLLAAIYVIANQLGGRKLGLPSVFLASVSWPFFYSAHSGRVDVLAAALGFVSIALYLKDRADRWWVGGLCGLCVGLAFEVHPHSVVLGLALVSLYFWHWRWSMFLKRHFWGFVVGAGAGGLFYAALHILPYPETYAALGQLAFGPTHVPPLLTFDLQVLGQALRDMGWLLIAAYQPLIPIIVWSFVFLAHRRAAADKTLLVLGTVGVLASALLIRNKFLYYAILFSPTLDLMVAVLLLRSFGRWRRRLGGFVSRVLIWGLCAGSIALNLSALRTDFGETYQGVQSRISKVVWPSDVIIGPQTYWFGLREHDYYSWEELIYYQRYAPGSTLEDALGEFRPDIFIIDGELEFWIADEDGGTTYSQHLRLPRTELETFLERQASLVAEFKGGFYGRIRVYRIAWDEQGSLLRGRLESAAGAISPGLENGDG
jgi:4-amino-4-deoxy-L-arabinose transferase-like glycosyltransferase